MSESSDQVVSPEISNSDFGPSQIGGLEIVLRTLGGLGGGIIGTGLIFLISILGSGIFPAVFGETSSDGTVHPLFVFLFLAMVFLGSATANLLGVLFIGLSNREKYAHLSTTLVQIFILNIVILILVAPVYMIVAGLNIEMIAFVAALQIVLSAMASTLILEIMANYRYALLGVYSTVLAILASSGVIFIIYSISKSNPTLLLFLALPTMWISIGFFSGLLGWFYGWIYKIYGTDFLSSAIIYGADVHILSKAEEIAMEQEDERRHEAKKRDEGAAFLKGGK